MGQDNADHKDKSAITRILDSGLIPLPILDRVMGFDAEEALRVRRELQQQRAVRIWCFNFLLIRGNQVGWGTGLSLRLFLLILNRSPFLCDLPAFGNIIPPFPVTQSSASKPPGYHEPSWAKGVWTSSATKGEEKERNTLLRKARYVLQARALLPTRFPAGLAMALAASLMHHVLNTKCTY